MSDGSRHTNKRPRMVTSAEDFQHILSTESRKYADLKKKFDILYEENVKLRKLLLKRHGKEDTSEGSEEEEEEGEEDEDTETEMSVTDEGATNAVIQSSERKAEESQPKKTCNDKRTSKKGGKSIPIFTTYNSNVRAMTDGLRKALGHNEFNIKLLSKTVTNVEVCTLADYEKIRAKFLEEKVAFYTYTPKGQSPYTVVIKGLSDTFDEREVREYIERMQIRIEILRIRKLGNNKWLLSMSRDSDTKGFHQIRYILHCRIFTEKYKRQGLTQCFNCQRFGHVSSNCNMPYRCVKCGGPHGPGKCEVPKKGENNKGRLVTDPKTGQASLKIGLPVKCVNCNIEGHVASSKECPRRRALLQKVEEKKAALGGRQIRESGTVRTGISYAAAAKGAVPAKPTSSKTSVTSETGVTMTTAMSNFNRIDSDCSRFFGGGLLKCLEKIGDFASEYGKLKSDEEKSRALLGMLMSIRHGTSS